MKYYLLLSDEKLQADVIFPCIVLRRDNWDDFGFKTTIYLEYYPIKKNHSIRLGITKILERGQISGYTQIPKVFESLDERFCSLGQEESYYKKLHEENLINVLRDLRDVAYSDVYLADFQDEEGYINSLLRFGRADNLIREARLIFDDGEIVLPLNKRDNSFVYSTYIPPSKEKVILNFDFAPDYILPFRCNVLVGENGTGKSILLSKLAVCISGIGGNNEHNKSDFQTKEETKFSDVIVLSYSPFDSFKDVFELNEGKVSQSTVKREFLPYTFFGLRKLRKTKNGENEIILKSHRTIIRELRESFEKVLEMNRLIFLEKIIEQTFLYNLKEPSAINLVSIYEKLSSGQKIVLKIIVDLIGQVRSNNLILFDEPESYLHPQGVSEFFFAINMILDEFDAYSIVATHSPIIVQETPSKYVTILKRRGFNIKPYKPTTETLGQSLNSIITEAFGLSVERKRFYTVFDNLLKEGLDLNAVEKKLGKPLSLNASSYLLSNIEK